MIFPDARRTDVRVNFFFNDTATTEIYTLSLHDALPISAGGAPGVAVAAAAATAPGNSTYCARARITPSGVSASGGDRKSTRLNSSHANISYAVFCLKKKKTETDHTT